MSEHSQDAEQAPAQGVTRRELFQAGNALALPLLFGSAASLTATAADGPLVAGPEIYQSIGVEPVINCRGTFTIIGGSIERPEVRAAMDRLEAFCPDRRAGRSGGTALRGDHRARMGHGLGGMRGGDEARHGRLRHGRQSREADSHPRPHRPGQDEVVVPRAHGTCTTTLSATWASRWSRSRRSRSSRTRSTRERP